MLDDLVFEEVCIDVDVLIMLGDMLWFCEWYDEVVEIYIWVIDSVGLNYEEFDWLLFYVCGVVFECMKDWLSVEVDLKRVLEIFFN